MNPRCLQVVLEQAEGYDTLVRQLPGRTDKIRGRMLSLIHSDDPSQIEARASSAHRQISLLAALVLQWACGTDCFAGGGPENVFLVVNQRSQDSITVANHYIDLRKIPPNNVFYLIYQGSKAITSGQRFRDIVLLPTLAEIERRKLGGQVDYIIYSCDFPFRIDFPKDFPDANLPPQLRPIASLTGATYLFNFAKEKRKEMFSVNNNFYCPSPSSTVTVSKGFRSKYRWTPGGKRAGAAGLSYMLSATLGVTYGRGNTTEEIARYLKRAVEADGTKPKGTVYFVKNGSARSKPRHDFFDAAAKDLRIMGVSAKVLEGTSLQGKNNVIGMTTGAPQLEVKSSRCRFLPGAFCDNFTSCGGQFHPLKQGQGPGQTCISEFLRFGAAGASGTVIEPFTIRQKFPLPSFHVHYARGCSLAEAFYQSVEGPYQQILVGDPLCQPWADRPVVKVKGVSEGKIVRGTLDLEPSSTNIEVRFFELFVDGVRSQRCRPSEKLTLDTTTLADGYHELRIVATDTTPIETQGRWIGQVLVKNGRNAVQLTVDTSKIHTGTEQIAIRVASTLDDDVEVTHNGRQLGTVEGGNGILPIETELLGTGPITLVGQSNGQTKVRSQPLRIELN